MNGTIETRFETGGVNCWNCTDLNAISSLDRNYTFMWRLRIDDEHFLVITGCHEQQKNFDVEKKNSTHCNIKYQGLKNHFGDS